MSTGSPDRVSDEVADEGESLDAVVSATARDACAELERIDDPLEAELYVSALLGQWWGIAMDDVDPEVVIGEAVVAEAARLHRTGAVALLRCVARLGTPAQRAAAAAGAAELAAAGVGEPEWSAVLGRERVTATAAYGDVYGDQTCVLLGIERAGAEHGVVVLIAHSLDGIAKDTFVVPSPAEMLADIRSAGSPTVWVRELSPAAAAELLYPAFAAVDAAVDPPVEDGFPGSRALAAARVRLLDEVPVGTSHIGAAERRTIVAEFLASDVAADLPAGAGRCAELLVDFGCDVDRGQPLRVGPAKIERFLTEWPPAGAEPSQEESDALPATLLAWTAWAAQRTGLPQEATDELLPAVEDMLGDFEDGAFEDVGYDDDGEYEDADPEGTEYDGENEEGEAADQGDGDASARAYLGGVDPRELTPESAADLLRRRRFAVPHTDARIDGEDIPGLDPGDPDDRALLIATEHPGHREASAAGSAVVDGLNRAHLAVHEIVLDQLWTNDPPELWHAAQRLLAAGLNRHAVLHVLGAVVTRHLHLELTGRGAVDLDRYVADLAGLRPQDPQGARPAG